MNMKVYLVINQPRDMELPYKEQYKVFHSLDEAKIHATKCGMVDQFGMGVNTNIGSMTMYWAGNIRVSILPLEIEDLEV